MLRIALAQINPIVGDLDGNARKILDFVQEAKAGGAHLAAFPELVLTGYPPEDLLLKDHFVRANLKALNNLAKKISGIAAIVGFVDRDSGGKIYNAAAVISEKKIRGIYRKQDLPNYGVFDEKRYFTAGDKNPVFVLNGVAFAVNICEDIWRDETAICKKQVRAGAKFLINISSSPFEAGKIDDRIHLVRRRAKETKAPVCYVNLVGGQDELVFDGASMAASAKGVIIASGRQFAEDIVLVDLDVAIVKKKRAGTIHLGNVKPSGGDNIIVREACALSMVEQIHHALLLATRDYIRKNGFKKVLIGLSGGIDSAVVAAVAAEAIGRENVIGVSMPSRFNAEVTKSDARKLAENLGIVFKEISIEPIFETYLNVMTPHFKDRLQDCAEENIQARIRGNILMALSNKFNWLVLTTGNKSEMAVGYCTLYGDMSGGFAVIKDVPKTIVYKIAKDINRDKELIPQSVIDRVPSAELRENQTDQDSLPPYDLLDDIIERYVGGHESLQEISRKHDPQTVKRVRHLIDANEYKRRQSPPGPKVTSRAFGKDWRLPITNQYRD